MPISLNYSSTRLFAVLRKKDGTLLRSERRELDRYVTLSWRQKHEDWYQDDANRFNETNISVKECTKKDLGHNIFAENQSLM